jgi:hypothetical protein
VSDSDDDDDGDDGVSSSCRYLFVVVSSWTITSREDIVLRSQRMDCAA